LWVVEPDKTNARDAIFWSNGNGGVTLADVFEKRGVSFPMHFHVRTRPARYPLTELVEVAFVLGNPQVVQQSAFLALPALAKGLKTIAQPLPVLVPEIISDRARREEGGAKIDGHPNASALYNHARDVITSISRHVFARGEGLRLEPYPKAVVVPPASNLLQVEYQGTLKQLRQVSAVLGVRKAKANTLARIRDACGPVVGLDSSRRNNPARGNENLALRTSRQRNTSALYLTGKLSANLLEDLGAAGCRFYCETPDLKIELITR
jgi:hypothetical protein